MAEEKEEVEGEDGPDETASKPRFKISKPNPMVYFIIGPFIIVFVVYIVLTKILITSDLEHEAKLEELMKLDEKELISGEDQLDSSAGVDGELIQSEEEAGFLDIHNYFQFPVAFAVNIPKVPKTLTFELAVSSFQSGVTAEWFFKNFTAFVPALRSDILYFMGGHSLEDLQSPDFQALLLNDLKDVINAKLESLGAKPEISKVLFVTFVIT